MAAQLPAMRPWVGARPLARGRLGPSFEEPQDRRVRRKRREIRRRHLSGQVVPLNANLGEPPATLATAASALGGP